MAVEKWVTVKKQWCDVIADDAKLMERRVYAANVMPDTEPYRVLERKCSAALQCNLLGCTCRWAYTGPTVDRFSSGL